MKKVIFIAFAFIVAFSFTSCKSRNGQEPGKETNIEKSGVAVCIWDNLPLREAPASDGKWLASVSLGEKCKYLREEKDVVSGEKTVKYVKVELQDGKEGWVQADLVVVNGKPAVIAQDAVIYSRPDLLTKTNKSFSKMDIIGIKGEQADFVEVSGKRRDGKWIETGWIKSANLSYSDIDIAVAKYALKALANTDKAKRNEAVNEIINNPDLKGSLFIEDLKAMVMPADEAADAIEQEVLKAAGADSVPAQ